MEGSAKKLCFMFKGRHQAKINVLIRALPESGGGLPLPEFFGPFFPPSNSP